MPPVQIVGRSSSLYTRLPLMFAEELSVPYEIVPLYDMTETGADVYAGNPALKIPVLRMPGSVLFGAQNICRALAERAPAPKRIVWPEDRRDDLSRNAQELVWHCMAMQVQLVFGTLINKLPASDLYFVKARTSFEGSLRWLNDNLEGAVSTLPARDFSMLEVSLHCLIEHLTFRATVEVDPYPSLLAFSREYAKRPAARDTVYRFDAPASASPASQERST